MLPRLQRLWTHLERQGGGSGAGGGKGSVGLRICLAESSSSKITIPTSRSFSSFFVIFVADLLRLIDK